MPNMQKTAIFCKKHSENKNQTCKSCEKYAENMQKICPKLQKIAKIMQNYAQSYTTGRDSEMNTVTLCDSCLSLV